MFWVSTVTVLCAVFASGFCQNLPKWYQNSRVRIPNGYTRVLQTESTLSPKFVHPPFRLEYEVRIPDPFYQTKALAVDSSSSGTTLPRQENVPNNIVADVTGSPQKAASDMTGRFRNNRDFHNLPQVPREIAISAAKSHSADISLGIANGGIGQLMTGQEDFRGSWMEQPRYNGIASQSWMEQPRYNGIASQTNSENYLVPNDMFHIFGPSQGKIVGDSGQETSQNSFRPDQSNGPYGEDSTGSRDHSNGPYGEDSTGSRDHSNGPYGEDSTGSRDHSNGPYGEDSTGSRDHSNGPYGEDSTGSRDHSNGPYGEDSTGSRDHSNGPYGEDSTESRLESFSVLPQFYGPLSLLTDQTAGSAVMHLDDSPISHQPAAPSARHPYPLFRNVYSGDRGLTKDAATIQSGQFAPSAMPSDYYRSNSFQSLDLSQEQERLFELYSFLILRKILDALASARNNSYSL